MKQGERRLLFSVLGILAAALVLLVAQRVRGSDTPRVYRVSVLLSGTEEDAWRNFRAGLGQAALEQNVDLRFITRYDASLTQADALRREWEGEADGVVILPADGESLARALEEAPAGLAVCVAGPALPSGRVDCYVSPDYDRMGRSLAQAVAVQGEDCTLYLSPAPSPAALLIAAGLEAGLAEAGVTLRRQTVQEGTPLSLPAAGALAAVEPKVAETLCAAPGVAGRVYGAGLSDGLLRALEDGTAAALLVQSDFDAGYLSLSRIVARLNQESPENAVLESYTATGDNMFQYPMSDILFSTY